MTIERSRSAVRAALTQHAPEDCTRFEEALQQAKDDFDVTGVDVVLHRWHGLATMAVSKLDEQELAQVARARAGDFTGWHQRGDDGTWVTL